MDELRDLLPVLSLVFAFGGAWFGVRGKINALERRADVHSSRIEDVKNKVHQHDIRLAKLEN